ncbi:hypothetical protein B0O99DRAFT_22287 [Bisporella sp. PMI_857]|nr:hypothetical protein B0O99DRAFT_22287 [Bisporella sp. PMI_857]
MAPGWHLLPPGSSPTLAYKSSNLNCNLKLYLFVINILKVVFQSKQETFNHFPSMVRFARLMISSQLLIPEVLISKISMLILLLTCYRECV